MSARWIVVACVLIAAIGINWAFGDPLNLALRSTYRFRLEAHFSFDGKPYTALGYMECSYERAWLAVGSRSYPPPGQPPIYEGYYVHTERESPSVKLADSSGAIVFRHGSSCPPLSKVQALTTSNESVSDETFWAYYFPDRSQPRVVWILYDRRPSQPNSGRYVLNRYVYASVKDLPQPTLEKTVPIVWQWYQKFSALYRNGTYAQRPEDMWSGIAACVMYEDEWRKHPDLVRLAANLDQTTEVQPRDPRRDAALACPTNGRTPLISLVPSDDYSQSTLDINREDLRWAVITTPYVATYRAPGTALWTPDICVAGEGCTGRRMRSGMWLYLRSARAFVQLQEHRFESFRFSEFAVRHGDGP